MVAQVSPAVQSHHMLYHPCMLSVTICVYRWCFRMIDVVLILHTRVFPLEAQWWDHKDGFHIHIHIHISM